MSGDYARWLAAETAAALTHDTEECGAHHDDVTSITCHRPKGHRRDHEGITTVTWEQDDRYCTTHGQAHWDDGDRTCQFTDDPASGQVAASPAAGDKED